MCFSPEASFTATAMLVPAGAYCLASACRKDRSQLGLATLPLFFGIQQFAEGMVWLAMRRGDKADAVPAALVFLFFAIAFWPFWVPFSALLCERRPWARSAIAGMIALSSIWTLFIFGPILLEPGRWLTIRVVHHSIQYDYRELPIMQAVPPLLVRGLYFLNIAAPLVFVDRLRGLKLPGLAFLASVLVAHGLFAYAFTSVWCLFAAAISASLCYAFWQLPKPGARTARRGDRAALVGGGRATA